MRRVGVLAVVLVCVTVAGCAHPAVRRSPEVAARPACPGPSWTTVPAALAGGKPVAVMVGQPTTVGISLTEVSNAQVDQLRIDVVPARAHVQDGAGAGIPVSDGSEPHVARLQVTNPAALGAQVLRFDGRDAQGRPLPSGDYQVFVVTAYRTTADCGPLPSASGVASGAAPYQSVAMIGTLSVVGAPASPSASPGMRWVTQDFGTDQPSLRLQVPTGWRPYAGFVGQTGGTEWVNPADPDQRIAVVLGQCASCQQPELTRNLTVRSWLVDSAGGLIQPTEATIQWTSVTDGGQQGYFTDTTHIDDFCLNGDPDNPARGQTHDRYVALGYVHLVQKPIIEPAEVFAWAPTGIAETVINSAKFQPVTPTESPNPTAS
jgi:hypothetical protein